jgi:hypothetical protein
MSREHVGTSAMVPLARVAEKFGTTFTTGFYLASSLGANFPNLPPRRNGVLIDTHF